MNHHSILVPLVLILLSASCNGVIEIGLERESTSTPSKATAAVPSNTSTAIPTALPTNTSVPTLTELPTLTPTATPLPGLMVVPVTSLRNEIPWLPLDRARWPTVFIVTFNNQLPPFDNPLVRQAFAASINRDVIVEMAELWYAVDPSPATTFIPPSTLGRDLYGEVGIGFDPDHARDLLSQAGYTDPATFPKTTFLVNSYGETAPGARFNMANAMAEMWLTNLGVTVDVEATKPPTFSERIRSNPPALFWNGWLPDPGNDPDFIRQVFHTNGEYNFGHFSDPAFDSLVVRAAKSQDPTERQALYVEAERQLCEVDAGIIPLYHTYSVIH